MHNNGTTQPRIPIDQTSELSCDECGYVYFEQGVYIREVSGFLTGTGVPSLIPIPIFACMKCGHVNDQFLPREVREEKEKGEENS